MDLSTKIKESAARIGPTIGNPQWLKQNHKTLTEALPQNWTSVANSDFQLRFGFAIKLAGVEWREPFDIALVMYWLCHIGFLESRKDPHAAPGSIYSLIVKSKF